MKTKKLLISLFIFPLSLNIALAQSPILKADSINPKVGEIFTLKYVHHITSPGNADTNQVWDFSSMIPDSVATLTIIPLSGAPYASYFQQANIVGMYSYGEYDYLKADSTGLKQYGDVDSKGCIETYSQPYVYLTSAFTYPESITNIFTDNTCNGISTDTAIVTADGFGTLITPEDTFHNVLRAYYPLLGNNGAGAYIWATNGIHFSLLWLSPNIIDTTNINGDSTAADTLGYYGYYLTKNYSTGIIEQANEINSYDIYPNPAFNQLTIHTSSFQNEAATVSVMNVLGEIIEEEKLKWSGGNASININAIPAGIYFLQMKMESGSVVKRFVK